MLKVRFDVLFFTFFYNDPASQSPTSLRYPCYGFPPLILFIARPALLLCLAQLKNPPLTPTREPLFKWRAPLNTQKRKKFVVKVFGVFCSPSCIVQRAHPCALSSDGKKTPCNNSSNQIATAQNKLRNFPPPNIKRQPHLIFPRPPTPKFSQKSCAQRR